MNKSVNSLEGRKVKGVLLPGTNPPAYKVVLLGGPLTGIETVVDRPVESVLGMHRYKLDDTGHFSYAPESAVVPGGSM